MKSKKVPYIGLLCSVLFLCVACKDNAFIRRMQDMEMGVKNPSSIEELQSAIQKYQGKVNDILTMEQRIGIWYKILGRRYMDKKMYKKALEAFRSALEYFPENQHVFYQKTFFKFLNRDERRLKKKCL